MIILEKSWCGAVREQGHDAQLIRFGPYLDYYNFSKKMDLYFLSC